MQRNSRGITCAWKRILNRVRHGVLELKGSRSCRRTCDLRLLVAESWPGTAAKGGPRAEPYTSGITLERPRLLKLSAELRRLCRCAAAERDGRPRLCRSEPTAAAETPAAKPTASGAKTLVLGTETTLKPCWRCKRGCACCRPLHGDL